MKEITYTVDRLIPTTPEEKEVIKSWGPLWSQFTQDEKKEFGVLIIFGDWSGYKSAQYRVTHIDVAPSSIKSSGDIGTVEFTDGTTMKVWVERLTRKTILARGLHRKLGYTTLVDQFIRSGKSYYRVGEEE